LKPRDRWGNTPLDDAIKFGHQEIRTMLERAIKAQSNGHDKTLTLEKIR
jgi:glutaminase